MQRRGGRLRTCPPATRWHSPEAARVGSELGSRGAMPRGKGKPKEEPSSPKPEPEPPKEEAEEAKKEEEAEGDEKEGEEEEVKAPPTHDPSASRPSGWTAVSS